MNNQLITERVTINFFILNEEQKLESEHIRLIGKFSKLFVISGLTFEDWAQRLLSQRIIGTDFSPFETNEYSSLFSRDDLFLKVQRLDFEYIVELLSAILTQLDCGFVDLYYE